MTWASSPRPPTASSCNMPGSRSRRTTTRALFADPHHPYTAALLAALPERATQRRLPAIPGVVPGQFDRPSGCLFAPRCEFVFAACRAAPPPAGAAALGRARCCLGAARPNAEARGMSAVLEARALSREYPVSRGAVPPPRHASRRLQDVSFTLQAGRTLAVVGESGSGKSTLARLLTLIETPTRGALLHRGRGRRARRRGAAPAAAPRSADRVPEPLWLAQSAPEDRPGAGGAAARQHRPERGASARRRRSR